MPPLAANQRRSGRRFYRESGPGRGAGKFLESGPGSGAGKFLESGPGSGAGKFRESGPGRGAGKFLESGPGRGAGKFPTDAFAEMAPSITIVTQATTRRMFRSIMAALTMKLSALIELPRAVYYVVYLM
jgi:hypothetical protein